MASFMLLAGMQEIMQYRPTFKQNLGNWDHWNLDFKNINRSPSYLYARKTAFPVARTSSFNDENVTAINAGLYLNRLKARLTFSYFFAVQLYLFQGLQNGGTVCALVQFYSGWNQQGDSLGEKMEMVP